MKWLDKGNDDFCNKIKANLSVLLPYETISAGIALTPEGKMMRAVGIGEHTYFIDELFSPSASHIEVAKEICKQYKGILQLR